MGESSELGDSMEWGEKRKVDELRGWEKEKEKKKEKEKEKEKEKRRRRRRRRRRGRRRRKVVFLDLAPLLRSGSKVTRADGLIEPCCQSVKLKNGELMNFGELMDFGELVNFGELMKFG